MEIHNDRRRRFYTTVEGGDAHILYRWGSNNSYDLFATYVPTQSRGQNIADKLVREAIRTAPVIPSSHFISPKNGNGVQP